MNTYKHEGKRVDYTPGSAVATSVPVRTGNGVGVVVTAITASGVGSTGQLEIEGVHSLAAVAAESWGMLEPLYLNSTPALTQVAAGNTYAGLSAKAKAASATTAEVKLNAGSPVTGESIQAASAVSSTITNTTDETAFSLTATIDGTALKAGDVIRVQATGTCPSTNSTDTLNIKLKFGTEEIIATGAVDVADNDIFHINADIVVRTAGASGAIVGSGTYALGVPGTVTAKPFLKASASEDISGDTNVSLTATWSVAHADNQVQLDILNVQKL